MANARRAERYVTKTKMKKHSPSPSRLIPHVKLLSVATLLVAVLTSCVSTQREPGFVSLFDGKTLAGWTLVGKHGAGYGVTNGVIYCAPGGGGNLLTDQEFDDFILRFEFKLEDGSNNGIGIRAPHGMVLVSGQIDVTYAGHPAVSLKRGDYAYGPAALPHTARCNGAEACTLFIAFNGAVDALPFAGTL